MKAVNLLPSDLRGQSAAGSVSAPAGPPGAGVLGAYAVLGVLAFCVVAMLGWVLTGNAIQQREAELARVTAEGRAVQQRAAALKPYADLKAAADARTAAVRDLAGARFDWEQALRDLSRAVPAGVSLRALSGDVGVGQGNGATSNPLRPSIDAPAIELQGCTDSQAAVAETLARLRNVDGVTRVSLAKSEKGSNGAAAPSGEGQAQRRPVPGYCGPGDPPSFDIVVFFERAAAAVKTAPGAQESVTAAPVATPAPAEAPAATPAPAADGGTEVAG